MGLKTYLHRSLLLIAVSCGLSAILLGCSTNQSAYKVDVLFDNAKGIAPGQLVKIQGARVGTVDAVNLVPAQKARVTLSVDDRYRPFRKDASCRILPEGLLSENYIECTVGTSELAELAVVSDPDLVSRNSPPNPTVPVKQTSAPVSLQDLVNVFTQPTNQRLRAIVNELGLSTAGRGDDLNGVIRRANPNLQQVNALLKVIARDERALGDSVSGLDQALTALRRRRGSVKKFVESTNSVVQVTAARSSKLEQSVAKLPRMLRSTDTLLGTLNETSRSTVPLISALRRSAPAINTVNRYAEPFTKAAAGTLQSLASASVVGREAVTNSKPAIRSLKAFSKNSAPFFNNLEQLTTSLRDTGGIEPILMLFFGLAAVAGSYDEISHLITMNLHFNLRCWFFPEQRGCDRRFSAPGGGTLPMNDPEARTDMLYNSVLWGGDLPDPDAAKRQQAPLLPWQQATRRADHNVQGSGQSGLDIPESVRELLPGLVSALTDGAVSQSKSGGSNPSGLSRPAR